MANLIVYQPDSPLLIAFCRSLRIKTYLARKEVSRKKDMIHGTASLVMHHHKDLLQKISSIRTRIRMLERGVPATESLDPQEDIHQLDNNLSDADKFLLKKAYRKAASLAHPDRGGSVEEFQAVQAAYQAGDLSALNEYFIASGREGILSQIDYWIVQKDAASVDWEKFQTTNEFIIARMYERGDKDKAISIAGDLLREVLLQAQIQERLLAFKEPIDGFNPTTVNYYHGGSV